MRDISAASTRASDDSRLKTIVKAIGLWGIRAFPPSQASWKALAATLKLKKFKSAPVYFSVYRTACERQGFILGPLLARAHREFQRSCMRGIGGPVRPRPLPMERLHHLPGHRLAWNEGGPLNPRAAIIAGTWFLCREIELSTSRARLLELCIPSSGRPSVTWHLPASKNDQAALGYSRSLVCRCSPTVKPSECPVHVLWDHACFLRHRFPSSFVADVPNWDLPLFPDEAGSVVLKSAMTETIRQAAARLEVPLVAPDGSERVSGHSLRVSGAQGLIRLGWHPWAVQLQGRWESDAVKRYIRDAPLSSTSVDPGQARSGPDLEHLVAEVVRQVGRSRPVPVTLVPKCAGSGLKSDPVSTATILGAERFAGVDPAPSVSKLVLHTGSGMYHRRLSPQDERSACGWNFGGSSTAADVPDRTAGPTAWFQLCGRCWPTLRASAKLADDPAWLNKILEEASDAVPRQ